MRISIDTNEELTDLDQQILMMVLGGEVVLGVVEETEPEPEPVKPAAKKAAAKAPAKKAAPKPEPIAEEPVEEDDDLIGDEAGEDEYDDVSDEDLLELAVKKATEMVAGGQAAAVREALDAAGASRVRELNTDNVREFFKALA